MSAALSRWLALVALLLFGTACATAANRAALLPAGPAVVVIAPAAPSAEDRESETYADYAEYLNAFAAHRPARLRMVRMTAARWRQLVRRPLPRDDYAVVFVRRGGGALLLDGMPLEAAVYDAGARWALDGAVPSPDTGLTAATLVRR